MRSTAVSARAHARALVSILLLLVVSVAFLPAQEATVWERAVEAVQHDRQAEAVPLLQAVVAQEPARGEAVRMLAVALRQTNRPGDAETELREALSRSQIAAAERGRIAFDLAALLQAEGRLDEAIALYGRALELDNTIASAYLNRANARVTTASVAQYEPAASDYELYLALRPGTSQRPQIERMIALLRTEVAAEREREAAEAERRAAEEAARQAAAEAARIAEERAREQAAERRERMLSSVLQSLDTAATDAESFELENEEIESYDEDLDIID